MVEQKVEFRKVRDFGENLSDTFLFLRQNFKSLIKSFFAIGGVFMLAYAIFNGIYQSRAFSIFDQLRKGMVTRENDITNIITPEHVLTIVLALLFYVSMRVILAAYVKFYAENNNTQPGIEEVWNIFRKYFLKVFIFNIPIFLLMCIGFVFCIAPGVWLAVVFVPFDIILVVEGLSFGDAFKRCFTLVTENFWISFATYLVAGLIYWFCAAIIGVFIGVIIGLSAFLTTNNIGATAGILTSILNILASVFYFIFFVSAALHYFNLVEKHDGTGILQRIENMGNKQDNFDNIQENY